MDSQPPVTGPEWVGVNEILEGAPPFVFGLVDIIRRSGAYSMQIRYNDEPEPAVWVVVSQHHLNADGRPTNNTDDDLVVEAAASPFIGVALSRLAEQLLDGGQCAHCLRPTIFHDDPETEPERWMRVVSCPVYWHEASGAYVLECQQREKEA